MPVFRDAAGSAASGMGYVVAFKMVELYTSGEVRIDVSSEAGDRFQANVTGFRLEATVGIDARPIVFGGWCQRVIGL